MSKKVTENLDDINELFTMKLELTRLLDQYIQAKIDIKLKNYYSTLSMQLVDQVISEIDKSTSKIIEKFEK